MRKRILFLVCILFVICSCNVQPSFFGNQAQPSALPVDAIPCVTSTPQPWTYFYDIQNYELQCPISEDLFGKLVMEQMDMMSLGDADYAELLSIQECRRRHLNEYINQKGSEGWEMLSFETMDDPTAGIESAYRIMWKKPGP